MSDRPGPRLLPAIGMAIAATTLACALVLVIRRMQVSFDTSGGACVAAAFVGIILVVAVDVASSWERQRSGSLPRWVVRLGLALALAATLPAPSAFVDPTARPGWVMAMGVAVVVTSIALVAPALTLVAPAISAFAWFSVAPASRRHADRGRRNTRRDGQTTAPRHHREITRRRSGLGADSATDRPVVAATTVDTAPHTVSPIEASVPMPGVLPPGVLQQRIERYLLPDERVECLRGTLHLTVVAGSRLVTGHVGFCPPFHQLPFVEAGTRCEEVEATIVAAEVLPWGARIECRLDEPADETLLIPIDIVARAPLPAIDASSPSPSR